MTSLILVATLSLLQLFTCGNTQAVTSNNHKILACPEFSITEPSILASPLYPEYPSNFYCEYNIQAPKDSYVVIKFENFNFPPRSAARRGINLERVYPRCEKDFLEISDDHRYVNKFKYCGREMNQKEFVSQGSSVKLILQMMNPNFNGGGFKASVSFPMRQNFVAVSMHCTPQGGKVECKAPLDRVMTPESSVDLVVDHRGPLRNCSQDMTLTTEYLEYPKDKLNSDHVMDLIFVNERCEGRMSYSTIQHLTQPDAIVYQVTPQEQDNFDVILKQFSTKQKTMCGGHVYLERNKPHQIRYTAYHWNKPQTCMWILHADPTADKIEVDISKFTNLDQSNDCSKHHLSMMHIGVNMFEILKYEMKDVKNKDKYKRICNKIENPVKKIYSRPERNIYGAINVMVLLSHEDGFGEFQAEFKSKIDE